MGKRILISAGGTGGHLYPAQALGEQLAAQDPPCDILFAAGGLNASRYFNRDRFPFQEVSCSPLLVKNPVRAMAGLKNLVKGTRESIRMIERFKPDVVVGFGSYYTTPILIAAKWMKIPIIVHEANSIPGKANKWMASFCRCSRFELSFCSFLFQTADCGSGPSLTRWLFLWISL